jgi:hypothetical protein
MAARFFGVFEVRRRLESLFQNSTSNSPQASETASGLRIEEDKPPRHKGTKPRIGKYFNNLKFLTLCLGDLVVNFFSVPTFDTTIGLAKQGRPGVPPLRIRALSALRIVVAQSDLYTSNCLANQI